ncbi:hypothetical protein [Flavobacterium hibisci]|uniref:hypothetical protein n=1 Tax=Flavobacterium hibisci TaxID=1914462 RepID=UPI001CBECF12|nr:hypothetical protein [Flavobacterium hibisci]MBZ4042613.1 hypothetical protein [Flavobacterium hibisci]
MERCDIGFYIHISVAAVVHRETVVKGGSTRNKYDGRIAEFIEFGQDFLYINFWFRINGQLRNA